MPDLIEITGSEIRAGDHIAEILTPALPGWTRVNGGSGFTVTDVRCDHVRGFNPRSQRDIHNYFAPKSSGVRVRVRRPEETTMTAKDFRLLAAAVNRALTEAGDSPLVRRGVLSTAHAICNALKGTTARFDAERFLTACGVPDNQ